jgi:hypothetical protein
MSKSKKLISVVIMMAMLFTAIAPGIAAAADEPKPAPAESAPATSAAAPAEPAPAQAGGIAAVTNPDRATYEQGLKDGEAAAIKHYSSGVKAGWFLAGFGTGIIGTGVAYLSKPKSTAMKYIQAPYTPEYEKGFKEGFCKYANKTRGKWAAVGWGTWVLALMASGGGGNGGN